MHNSPVSSLAFRYLSIVEQGTDGRVRFSGFSNKQSLNSIIGLSLGVGVLLIVLSIVNGFEREMRERVLAVIPHAILHQQNGIEDWQALAQKLEDPKAFPSDVKRPLAVAPLIEFQALLVSGERLASAQVKGIEPAAEKRVSIIHQLMQSGRVDDLNEQPYGMILGVRLAEKLGLEVGDKLRLVLPEARVSLLGLMPRYRQFELIGLVEVGSVLDEQLAYIHLDAAGKLLRTQDKVTQVRLKMPDLFSASWDVWEWVSVLNEQAQTKQDENKSETEEIWYASDWTQNQGSLYEVISTTKSMLGLLVLLIVLVACFNLASGLIMLVNEKRADIAILLSQGLQARQLVQVFVVQALLIALTGLVLGLSLASLLLYFLGDAVNALENIFQVDLTSAYPVHYLPSQVLASDILVISVSVIVLSILASLYPAWLAARINPAEELKYE